MSSSIHFQSVSAFDVEESAFRLSQPTGGGAKWGNKIKQAACCIFQCWSIVAVSIAAGVALLLSMVAIVLSALSYARLLPTGPSVSPGSSAPTFRPISRLAFGSCTAHDLRSQPIWATIVASQPDAWVWVGDMAYVDNPLVDCSQVPTSPQCNCSPSFLTSPPYECFVGDIDHIRDRFQHQVSLPSYQSFLEFMCPGSTTSAAQFPAPGSDPTYCPRAVLGTYDDHDSGWNNGNDRLPKREQIKDLFLDAIGEPRLSPRRTGLSGLQASYTLPGRVSKGVGGMRPAVHPPHNTTDEVQVILLDERWYRDTLPCNVRNDWCERTLKPFKTPKHPDEVAIAWCRDFLKDDSDASPESLGGGSCCRRDEVLENWCLRGGGANNHSHPLWPALCDPTSLSYGLTPVAATPDFASEPKVLDASMFEGQQQTLWPWLVKDSPICDVLGVTQRRWLQSTLSSSKAALRIVASGSVPFGSLGYRSDQGECSGDDWQCWKPAQINFLHTLAHASGQGCVLILTGDYHYGDIKVVLPGGGKGYSGQLQTEGLPKPVWQFMSSGMTTSTAQHSGTRCEGSFLEDLVGLRPLGKCSYFDGPNFGTVDVDWDARKVILMVRDGQSGRAASDQDGVLQQVSFNLDTCQQL